MNNNKIKTDGINIGVLQHKLYDQSQKIDYSGLVINEWK